MSRITRVYLPPSSFADGVVHPDRDTVHYLTKVLRLRAGDRWAALDGLGESWLCEMLDAGHSRRIQEWDATPPLPVEVEVGLALCKGSRFEDALEKLAELGATKVVPLLTERTERTLPSQAKAERWQQIARSASALANRRLPLTIAPGRELTDYLLEPMTAIMKPVTAIVDPATAGVEPEPATLVYGHQAGESPAVVFTPKRRHYRLVIGPEGGLSPAETAALAERGAQAVSLGPLTLRVETAAVCATCLALTLAAARA